MGNIKVILPDDLEEEFREVIYKSKGMKKGNITKAIQEAIVLWMETERERSEAKQRKKSLEEEKGKKVIRWR